MPRNVSTGHSSFSVSLALAAGVLLAFWPVLSCGFLSLDDPAYVTANSEVCRGLSWHGLGWALTTFNASNWHPVTWLSHMLDAQVFGASAGGPHVVNLLFHLANTLLLFHLLRRLTGAYWRAAMVAGLFALHPLRVESVAWISERKDVVSAFFALLSLGAYARYAVASHTPSACARRGYLLALGFFALGLMSKPMLVTLPCVLLLLDYWPLRRFAGREGERGWRALRPLLGEKIPFFVLSGGCSVITFIAQRHGGSIEALDNFPPLSRVENALVSCGRYLAKTLWPIHLAMPYPLPDHWPVVLVAAAAALLAIWVALALRFARRMPFFLVGSLWFVGMLVPVLGLVQVGGQAMADRYTYMPQIGLWVALVWSISDAVSRWRVPKGAVAAAAGLILSACTLLTRAQVGYWHDSQILLTHTLAVTKANSLAYYGLGADYDSRGLQAQAIDAYCKALEIQPDFIRAHNNLAADLLSRGEWEGALRHYREVVRLDPGFAPGRNNYGAALAREHRFSEAIDCYTTALRLEPDYAEAHYNLALVLAVQHRFSEAIPHYTAAASAQHRGITYNNLGYALAALDRLDEAITAYRQAIRLDPKLAEAHANLGNALAREGDLDAAVRAYHDASLIDSNNPAILNNLGHALARKQDLSAAIACYEAALKLAPELTLARYNLAGALTAQGHVDLAVVQYQQVVAQDSGNALAHDRLARALAVLGRRVEALGQAREALRLKPDSEDLRMLVGSLERQ